MKLTDIYEASTKGTYAGARFDDASVSALEQYIRANKIPNRIKNDKMHTTILYSRKYCPDYKPMGKINPAWIAIPGDFTVWQTQASEGKPSTRCLVLTLNSPELANRHRALMKEHDATYDYPKYTPHITLSYDIGDIDVDHLPNIKDSIKELKVIEEYGEDLDLNWAKTKGV